MDLSNKPISILHRYPEISMVLATICLTIFTSAGKSAIPLFVIVFLRFFVPFILICLHHLHRYKLILCYLKELTWLDLVRSLFVLGSQYSFFYCVKHTSLFNANTLLNTAPAFILFLYFFYDRSFSLNKLLGVMIGFAGVLLILKPQQTGLNFALLAGVFSGFCWAVSNFTQSLMLKKLSNEQCMFYYYFYGSVLSLLILIFSLKITWFFTDLDIKDLSIIAVFSLSTLGFQYFSGLAYQVKSAFELSPYLYLTILFSWFVDLWIFHQKAPALSMLGALFIFTGVMVARHLKSLNSLKLRKGLRL